jgi:eukaryotic-like serine/threonine-protein kinase
MTDQPVDPAVPGDELTRALDSTAHASLVIGPYRLLRRLGEGGMGEVWLAEQTRPVHREVALKVIKAGMDTAQVVARFEAERQALAVMAHPAIAQVFDAGATSQGRPYFAMEYVRGEAITAYCDRHRLTTRQRLDLFLQVCDGVHHAHQKGIIHRDLKPSNILVTLLDDLPVPKIIDFGLAKATTRQLTEHTLFTEVGAFLGTPEYMSPEQVEMTGLDVDTRADVYALGVILYELLTGLLPFDAKALREKGLDELRRTIRETDPPRPSTRLTSSVAAVEAARSRGAAVRDLARALRGDLDWITLRALEKDRTRRYGSVSDLAADVHRHLDNLPVLASPPSVKYRAGKFVRRHRAGVTAGAVLVGLLMAFAATTGVQARRIARERDRANLEAATATAVNEFLRTDLLAQASSRNQGAGGTPDPEIKVRTLLDLAAARVAGKFAANPRVEAAIRATIGETYEEMGLYPAALEQLQRALDLDHRALGIDHAESLAVASKLGFTFGNNLVD